jgi:two-component system cell cycle sensor histidine kinase/response regulator CckA
VQALGAPNAGLLSQTSAPFAKSEAATQTPTADIGIEHRGGLIGLSGTPAVVMLAIIVLLPTFFLTRWLTIQRDVKITRRTLSELEARLQATYATVSDMVLVLDAKGEIVNSNPAASEILGYDRTKLTEMNVADLLLPDDRRVWTDAISRLDSKPTVEADVRLRSAAESSDGAPFPVRARLTAIDFGDERRRIVAVARDWRDKVRAETELRSVFAAMGDVVLVLSSEGRYLRIPSTNADRLYRPSDQLLGKLVSEVLPPEESKKVLAVIKDALETGSPVVTEYSLPFEEPIWFSATVSPLDDNSVVWVARDITAEKRVRSELAASRERYRLYFEHNPAPMWVFDRSTLEILEVNAAAVAHYGYTREEFTRMTLRELRSPQEQARLEAFLADASDEPLSGWITRHVRKDASVIDVEIRSYPLETPGRQARLVLATDITERLAAERGIRQAEAEARTMSATLQSLIDLAPPAIITTDAQGMVTRWNQAAEDLLGWKAAEVIGRPLPILPPDATNVGDKTRSDRRLMRGVETERARKDGKAVAVLLSSVPLRDAFGEASGRIMVLTDVTERRQLEAQLRQAQKMEAVGQLAGGVAHDFNNLLTVITSYTAILLSDRDPADASYPDLMEIQAAADRASALTRQLLAFSRRQVLQPQVLDLNGLIGNLQSMLRRLLREDIELIIRLTPDLWHVSADPGQLEQVLVNLAVNARDAMPRGGQLTIETNNVDLDADYAELHAGAPRGPYVVLSVADTGIGMPPEVQSRIFEPFFTTKAQGEGTGLGLAMVYGIVKQSGGYIWVYSEPGKGTTLKIYFPRDERALVSAETGAPVHRAAVGSGTILLVEDELSVRRAACRILQRAGYTVLEAKSGVEALQIADTRRESIVLVISDLIMPDMGGQELVSKLRERGRNIPVLLMSGYTEDAALRQSVLEPGTPFVNKPFTPKSLVDKVQEILSQGNG